MWYSFGPPSVFFTISPGDECSFRIKLFLNHKMVILPQNMEQNECIADLLFRSKLRLDNPGACSREYNSIMQIIMECLIGWNFKFKKQTSLGIFGKVFGWCDTTEEQARFTLHSHILFFMARKGVYCRFLFCHMYICTKVFVLPNGNKSGVSGTIVGKNHWFC